MKLVLVLGGARSGKSRFAQELAQGQGGPVLFVATAAPGDEEMRRRIQEHRRLRPSSWRTLEVEREAGPSLLKALGEARVVVLDCLTILLSNLLAEGEAGFEERVEAEVEGLLRAAEESDAGFIVVSNEVGLGLVPADPLDRRYRDALGRAHQRLAQAAQEVYFMMAGIPLKVKG